MNQTAQTNTEIVETKKPRTIKQWLQTESFMERLEMAVGDERMAEKFVSSVLLEVARNPQLEHCTPASIMECVIDSANYGLIPNKLAGQAWLIPYNNSYKVDGNWVKKLECTLQVGYKGYVNKFAENGWVVEVELVTIKEMEEGRFTEIRGSNPGITHSPIRDETIRVRDNIALGYAVARSHGMPSIYAVMTRKEIESAAKYEKAHAKGAWKAQDRETDYAEMCKKTVIRRLGKHCPISIVNEISSYEGEQEERILKDVTPEPEDKPDSKMSHINTGQPDEDGVIDGSAVEIPDEAPASPAASEGEIGFEHTEEEILQMSEAEKQAAVEASNKAQESTDAGEAPVGANGIVEIFSGKEWSEKNFDSLRGAASYLMAIMKNRNHKKSRQTIYGQNQDLQKALIAANEMNLIEDFAALISEGK